MSLLRTKGWPALVALLIIPLYAPTLDYGFHYDDANTVVHNPVLADPGEVDAGQLFDPASFSRTPGAGMFRPGVLVTYLANVALSGWESWSWRLLNVIIHAAVSVGVYWLSRLLGLSRSGAGVACLLFALHPLAVEPTVYISARAESLATLGILLAVCLTMAARRPARGVAGAAAMAVGLLCKATAAAAVPLIGLWERWVCRRRWQETLRALLPFGVLLLGYLILVRELVDEALLQAPVRDWASQLTTQLKVLLYYARLLVMPHPLTIEHPVQAGAGVGLASVGAALVLASLLWLLRKRGSLGERPRFLLAWMLIVLLPTIIVPLNVIAAERRLYPVLVAVCPLLVWLARSLKGRGGVVAAATIVLFALSSQRSDAWASQESLWQQAVEVAPSTRALVRLGTLARSRGALAEAEIYLRQAVRVDSSHAPAWNNLGNVRLQAGDAEAAERDYRKALSILPRYPEALTNLAALRVRQGDLDSALDLYQRALEIHPRHGSVHNNLGTLYLRRGEPLLAERHLRRALQLGERAAGVWFNLSGALEAQDQAAAAIEALDRALQTDATYAPAYLHRGNLLAAADRTGDAVNDYQTFLRLWRGDADTAQRVRAMLQRLESR